MQILLHSHPKQMRALTKMIPPTNYEDLIRLIHERHDQMSKTYQRISVFLTQNPNEVAVQSVVAIAERCGAHASSFVRFAQTLGYREFKDFSSCSSAASPRQHRALRPA